VLGNRLQELDAALDLDRQQLQLGPLAKLTKDLLGGMAGTMPTSSASDVTAVCSRINMLTLSDERNHLFDGWARSGCELIRPQRQS
jgi:hypothetical protein